MLKFDVRILPLSLLAIAAGCSQGGPTDGPAEQESAQALVDVPEANVQIVGFLEIDDLDGTGPSPRDANLCGPTSTSIGCTGYTGADNPNFPGQDPSAPNTLGAEADYIDWADLIPASGALEPPYFLLDLDTSAGDDDIFQVGSCVDTGHSPNKANLNVTAVAGNEKYLYLGSERETTNGSEKHHYILTQKAPHLGPLAGCPNDTWLWNLKTGDVLVELTFPSTADLADGVVDIKRWTGGATANVPAEDLLLDPSWTLVPAGGGTLPAYTAFNVAYNKTKSPNDDDEPGFDGVDMATGQLAEMAIDIKAVFGQGCGLRRTLAAISTASASPNGNDDLKDFVSPTTILTASIELGVTLSESCDEGFNWAASAKLGSDDLIGDPDIDLVIQYNCGSGVHEIAVTQTTGFEPVVGGGSCTAKLVARNGTGRLTSCDAESKPDNANAYPPLDVTAALAQANCGDDFTYDATPSGGSPPYAFSWTFTGPSAIASSSQEDGSAGITGAGTVNGAVTVTDSRFAALGCSDGDNNDTPVYSSLVASLTATPGDLACFDSDIPVTATMSGGSGAYTLNWNLTDEDGTNDATTSCSDGLGLSPTYCGFNLGGAVCAKAKLELSVSDPVCAQAVYAGGVGAERTSKVTVGALASP